MNGRFLPAVIVAAAVLTTWNARGGDTGAHPQQAWWRHVQELCGQAFAGELSRYDEEQDAAWIDADMVMHVRECTDSEIRIPLHVDGDRSRTWVLTRTDAGIRLKHDHRHEDGSEDVLTQYGGHTSHAGDVQRQEFPADDFSKDLFESEGIPDSAHNTWYMEVVPGQRFSYGLGRFNRDFRADFDLSEPVEPPPAPWGAESGE